MEKIHSAGISEKSGDLAEALMSSGIAFLLGCTSLFGAQSPLAVVWLAGMSGVGTVFALCGGVVGYIAGGSIPGALPYIAAMAAAAAFRLLFGGFKSKTAEFASAVFAAVCVLASGVIFAGDIHDIFIGAAFAVITLVCTQALFTAKRAARSFAGTSPAAVIELGILGGVLTAALMSIAVQPFYLGMILSSAALVHVSDLRKGRSAAAGIICAAGIAVGNGDFIASGVILSVCGLILVPLERYSRLTRACALIFAAGVGVLITGVDENSAAFLVSTLTGALLRTFVPERFLPAYRDVYSPVETARAGSFAPYAAFGRRLTDMSEAVGEMETAIKKTAQALDKRGEDDISSVYINAGDEVCKSCGNSMDCWGTRYNRSADIMNKALCSIRRGIPADETMLSGHFADICARRKELSQALNKQYAIFCSARSASRRVSEMRRLLSAQLDATRKLLDRAAQELDPDGAYDTKAAEAVCALLRECGLTEPSALAVVIDGTLTVDAYAAGTLHDGAEEFAEKLSRALGKSFDPPMMLESGGQVHITISERSPFDAQIRIYGKSKSGSRVSGDCAECFNDGRGNVYMILSDGMGSGSRARIDSAFACSMLARLLKAGIDFSASMEMLNNSLTVKSSDESFATLDICRIDLYSGEVTLYKAGGAETFVRCGKKFAKINGSGIPFGVSVPARYSESSFTLSKGDAVIMASDGAQLEQTWLEQLVMRETFDLDSVLDTVGETLRLSAEKGKEDDVTVIGVKITA